MGRRGEIRGGVVRSDLPFVYKIKPRHSIDAVVVGFSEGAGAERGQVRSLLLALMPREGRCQITGRVGSGLVEEVRELLFAGVVQACAASEFIETDANLVTFRMVWPEVAGAWFAEVRKSHPRMYMLRPFHNRFFFRF